MDTHLLNPAEVDSEADIHAFISHLEVGRIFGAEEMDGRTPYSAEKERHIYPGVRLFHDSPEEQENP